MDTLGFVLIGIFAAWLFAMYLTRPARLYRKLYTTAEAQGYKVHAVLNTQPAIVIDADKRKFLVNVNWTMTEFSLDSILNTNIEWMENNTPGAFGSDHRYTSDGRLNINMQNTDMPLLTVGCLNQGVAEVAQGKLLAFRDSNRSDYTDRPSIRKPTTSTKFWSITALLGALFAIYTFAGSDIASGFSSGMRDMNRIDRGKAAYEHIWELADKTISPNDTNSQVIEKIGEDAYLAIRFLRDFQNPEQRKAKLALLEGEKGAQYKEIYYKRNVYDQRAIEITNILRGFMNRSGLLKDKRLVREATPNDFGGSQEKRYRYNYEVLTTHLSYLTYYMLEIQDQEKLLLSGDKKSNWSFHKHRDEWKTRLDNYPLLYQK